MGPEMSPATLPTSEQLGLAAEWTLDADETIHALAMWFDVQLTPDRWYENAPGSEYSVWGQTILPVFPPLEVRAGESVRVNVRPERHPDGAPGWLSWSVESGDEQRHGHEFAAEPASLGDLYGGTLVSDQRRGCVE